MAHDSKQGFLSSLFGRKRKGSDEAAELESKHRLDERIRQALAERIEVPDLRIEGDHAALLTQEKGAEVELLPISANGLDRRRAPVPVALLPSSVEVVRSYTANQL